MTGRCLVSGDESEGRQNTVTEGRGLKLELGGGGSEVNVGRGGGKELWWDVVRWVRRAYTGVLATSSTVSPPTR